MVAAAISGATSVDDASQSIHGATVESGKSRCEISKALRLIKRRN